MIRTGASQHPYKLPKLDSVFVFDGGHQKKILIRLFKILDLSPLSADLDFDVIRRT